MNKSTELESTKLESTELESVNNELSEFLGEDTNKNLPEVIKPIELEVTEDNKMEITIPDELTNEMLEEIDKEVETFMKKVKDNPTDMTISSDVYKLGEKAAKMSLPKVALYDKLIVDIMEENKKGTEKEGSKDYNLLKLKKELDLINPAVLKNTPIKRKFLLFLNKTELPGSEKVMNMIYENKETVSSTIDGIKGALLINANDLDNQLADLMMVYKGLLESHKELKKGIFTAQLIYNQIADYSLTIQEPIAKENILAVQADLTTQINSLITEENMNAQFFAGSQLTAKLVREQQNQIRILVRQMEKSVLANLGLRVVAQGLEQSVDMSKKLGDSIATTIADTAKGTERTVEKLTEARTNGYINLEKLEEGVKALESSFIKQAKANELIVKQGLIVTKKVRNATKRLESRIDDSVEESFKDKEIEG